LPKALLVLMYDGERNSLSYIGTLLSIGPGLYELPRITIPRTLLNRAKKG
jgi:hypothetical protein